MTFCIFLLFHKRLYTKLLSSTGCQRCVFTHLFNIALHSSSSCTIILLCFTGIPFSFKDCLHRSSIPFVAILSTSYIRSYHSLHQLVHSIISICPNHLNTIYSAHPDNSRNTSSPSYHISHSLHTPSILLTYFISTSFHLLCYCHTFSLSIHTPQTTYLHFILFRYCHTPGFSII